MEGTKLAQFREYLYNRKGISIKTANLTDTELLHAIGIKEDLPNAEGLFYPATFSYGSSDIDVLTESYNMLVSRLTEAWNKRDVSNRYV